MMITSPARPSLDAYQLRLPAFEGPLDVLLRLIEREQLPISDVSLLAVLDQFLEFVRSLESPAPEVVAEFAAVAGRLSVLKSRALLPRPATKVEEQDESDLVRQLEEYRAVKVAAEHLAERQRAGNGGFARGESIGCPAPALPRLVPQPPVSITRAVTRWFTRLPAKPISIAPIRVVTLREMISRIFAALDRENGITFDDVRRSGSSRQETAVAFLAVLTLVRRQVISATQPGLFGPILLARTATPTTLIDAETTMSDDADVPEPLPA